MKIAKIVLLWMLLTILPLVPAMAQTVDRAAQPLDIAQFEHYPSFVQEEGHWSVNAIQADALMERFWTSAAKNNTEMCVFHVALEGCVETGVWTPVLRFYYADAPKAINARAVSLLADGVRYDLAASSRRVTQGRTGAELITAPMTAEAAVALQALTEAKNVSIRLMGDNIYTTTLYAAAQNERGQVEAASRDGLEAGFALLQDAGLSAYGLWDLSAAVWESEHGFRPAFARNELSAKLHEARVADPFGMVLTDENSAAARTAQAILIENAFLSEKPSNIFSQSAADAVLRAQRYLGMIETGCMDAQLAQALEAGRQTVSADVPELRTLGSAAEIALNRYWFARAVSASADEQMQRAVVNTDNVLLAADGVIRNLSTRQMHMFMEMEASVVYNGGYVYEASLVCECSEGTGLDTLLLPMAQARLIVYAEVPAYLVGDASASWAIRLTASGETLEFDLQ